MRDFQQLPAAFVREVDVLSLAFMLRDRDFSEFLIARAKPAWIFLVTGLPCFVMWLMPEGE